MTKFDELQAEHQQLLKRIESQDDPARLVDEATAYIARVRDGAEEVSSPRDRDQLRANLRFWASFVFDKTGTYPGTALRPARLSSAEPATPLPKPAAPGVWAWVIGMGLIGLVALVSLVVAFSSQAPAPIARTTAPTIHPTQLSPTLESLAAQTATAMSVVTTAEAATFLPTPPPTPTREPTSTPEVTVLTPSPATSFSTPQSPTPTPTQGPLGPATGPQDLPPAIGDSTLLLATLTAEKQDCAVRTIDLSFDQARQLKDAQLEGLTVRAIQAGSDGSRLDAQLAGDNRSATLDLSGVATRGPGAFVVQVDHPKLVFSSVIVQFSADCSRNRARIDYGVAQPIAPPRNSPDLDFGWHFLTWGPSPFGYHWVAVTRLPPAGGA